MRQPMKPFRERNPIPIAIIGLLAIVLGVLAAFNAAKLPFIGGGVTYLADFADAGGLQLGDDVRVAGVKVGQVTAIRLAGAVVEVSMQVAHGTALGSQTGAAIKIKTLLGQEYIALEPAGTGDLTGVIPITRTSTPFTVPAAFEGLSQRIEQINTTQLSQALTTLASAFQNTPPYVTASLQGLSRLSQTVYSRDQQLAQLLASANNVTGVLAGRDAQVRLLINDGDVVLQLIESQRAQIHLLLVNSAALAQQLTGLVQDNQAQLAPALDNLHAVLAILQKDQTQLGESVHQLGPFVRLFANTLGSGRWFDTFIANLAALPGSPQVGGTPLPLPSLPAASGGTR
ncbi:MAG: MCE family protein [Mycobacteriales bacterium]